MYLKSVIFVSVSVLLFVILFVGCISKKNIEIPKKEKCENRIRLIEEKLDIKIPKDLLDIWLEPTFKDKDRCFYFRRFEELVFLVPEELTKFSLERDNCVGVSVVYNEISRLNDEGKITKDEDNALKNSIYRDIILISKEFSGKKEKHLVFATSSWREGFVNMYYKFNSEGKSMGIFLEHIESRLEPIYLGANLEEVFGDLSKLKGGFEKQNKLENFIETYIYGVSYKNEDIPYGIFPQIDSYNLIQSIVPNSIIIKEIYFPIDDNSDIAKLNNIYKEQGKVIDFSKEKEEDVISFLDQINNQEFNHRKDKQILLFYYMYTENFGIALCTPEQARKLHDLGVLALYSKETRDRVYEFMEDVK